MTEKVSLPTYETLLTEAIRSLAIDSGTVTTPVPIGTNILNDNAKNWTTNVHKNRLVKIIRGAGAGQIAVINSNVAKSLVIKGSWAVPLDSTSVYQISEVDIVSEFTALKEALSRVLEVSEDSGTATGGSNTTIVDTGKNWGVDMWQNATVHVIHGEVEYVRLCSSNTADTLTIAALPAGVSVTAGDAYAIRRPVTIADISDRAARLLGIVYGSQGQQLLQRAATFDLLTQLRHAGVEIDPRAIRALTAADIVTVQSLTQWGGIALTGRDISLDLAKLDIALSAFRDALRGASTKDFTTLEADIESILAKLDVALSTRATETTLAKLIPIAKAAIFNTALPAAEANWLASDITPTNSPSYLRIYVCVSVAGVLRVARTIGATTVTESLNSGGALAADAAYMFTVPWRTGDSVNIRYSVATGTIKILRIEEIGGIG
jgi:hypothetical protein